MNQQYLENLDSAKESLKIWISNLEQKNLGNQMFSSEIEIDKNKTDFAVWYYGEGQIFSSFEAFRNIEDHYNSMYDRFLEYNYLNKIPVKRGFFSNNTKKRRDSLNNIFKKIKSSYDKLLKQVNFFQNTLIESPLFVNSSVVNKLQEDESLESNIAVEYTNQFSEEKSPYSADEVIDKEPETSLEFNDIDEFINQKPSHSEQRETQQSENKFELKDIDEFLDEEVSKSKETANIEQETRTEFNNLNEFIAQEQPQADDTDNTLKVEARFEIDETTEIEELESPKTQEFLSTTIKEVESEVEKEIANEERIASQREEKRAVLENNSTIKATDKFKKGNNIQPEIDIEEEIRRILS